MPDPSIYEVQLEHYERWVQREHYRRWSDDAIMVHMKTMRERQKPNRPLEFLNANLKFGPTKDELSKKFPELLKYWPEEWD